MNELNNAGRADPAPVFRVNIEGRDHPWNSETITTEQIAALGGWGPEQGVVEVDDKNDERTLTAGCVVRVDLDLSFGRKLKWKRG